MEMPYIEKASNVNDVDYFVRNTWMATTSESLGHGKFQIHCESASVIQTNRFKEIRPQHQCEENDLASASEQDFLIPSPSIQAELAEFWSHRANARLEYGTSKLLREKPAMAPTGAIMPARAAQRVAMTSPAPPPREPVLAMH